MKNKVAEVVLHFFLCAVMGMVRPSGSECLAGWTQWTFFFDIWKSWYSWGLYALWNSCISNFVRFSQKTAI